eukprot:gene5721-7903_t
MFLLILHKLSRLQVEHPVTDIITGLDLVKWQLRIASGEPIPLTQEEIIRRSKGCAMEARIYAENPSYWRPTAFITCIYLLHLSKSIRSDQGDFIRADTGGVVEGNTVSTYYDPMIAKLIAYGDDRNHALRRLEKALRNFYIAGIPNNVDFITNIIQHPGFSQQQRTTAFFEDHMDTLLKQLSPNTNLLNNHTQFEYSLSIVYEEEDGVVSIVSPSSLHVAVKSSVLLSQSDKNGIVCKVYNHSIIIDNQLFSGTVSLISNSLQKKTIIDVWLDGQTGSNSIHAQTVVMDSVFLTKGVAVADVSNPIINSSMPSKVIKVAVTDGQIVKQGKQLLL